MKLPVLDTYAFPVTLPSTGKTINMRPYLVREEKLLLMARESENYRDHVEAIAQIISNCTNGAIDPKIAPYFDIEYLLLQIRARSVGEIITPVYKCHNLLSSSTTECGKETPIRLDISQIPVTGLPQPTEKFDVPLNDEYVMKLRYPTIYTVHELVYSTLNDSGKFKSQNYLEALCDLFESVRNVKTGQQFNFDEYTIEEKLEFMESMSPRAFESISEFLIDLPTVSSTVSYVCDGCGFAHNITVAGVSNFLD